VTVATRRSGRQCSWHDLQLINTTVKDLLLRRGLLKCWRSAEVGNILRFEKDFPGAKVIRLERNYRSSRAYPGAPPRSLIAHNEGRLGKTLLTDGEVGGERVTVRRRLGCARRKPASGRRGNRGLQREGREPERRWRSSCAPRFADARVRRALHHAGRCPIASSAARASTERAEIRDALAYHARSSAQPDERPRLRAHHQQRRKRGIGDATVQLVHEHARGRSSVPLLAARADAWSTTDELKPKARTALRELVEQFDALARTMAGARPRMPSSPQTVLDESGYTEMWQIDKIAGCAGTLENLEGTGAAPSEEFENLAGFLEHVTSSWSAEAAPRGRRGVDHDAALPPRGWNSARCSCPAGRKACFRIAARARREGPRAGSRRSGGSRYVGLTRARRRL